VHVQYNTSPCVAMNVRWSDSVLGSNTVT